MKLYQLFTLEAGQWHPQFSDTDRSVVHQEALDTYKSHGVTGWSLPWSHIAIIKLPDDSADTLERARVALNKHGKHIKL